MTERDKFRGGPLDGFTKGEVRGVVTGHEMVIRADAVANALRPINQDRDWRMSPSYQARDIKYVSDGNRFNFAGWVGDTRK